MKKRIPVIFILLVFIAAPLIADGGQWEQIKDEKGITVKMRSVPGSRYKEYLTEAVINAPLEVVFEVQRDSSSYSYWFEDCIRQETLALGIFNQRCQDVLLKIRTIFHRFYPSRITRSRLEDATRLRRSWESSSPVSLYTC